MSKLFNCVMGEPLCSPFAPRSKMMPLPPQLGAAAITAGGSLVNNLLGIGSSNSSNRQNIEMQRETNAQNYKMFKEQQAFNVDMWNKQNAYNAPVEQVKRLLAAGINPQAYFGAGGTTDAGSLTAPQAIAAQSPRVNPYQPNIQAGEAVNAYYQAKLMNASVDKTKAETRSTELENMLSEKSMQDRLEQLHALAKGDGWKADLARTELQYMQDTMYWRQKQLRNDILLQQDQMSMNRESIYNQRLQNGLAEVQLAYAPQMSQAQLSQYYTTVAQLKAQIGLINANRMLTDEQRRHEIIKKTGSIIDNRLKNFDLGLKNATKKFIISSIAAQAGLDVKDLKDYESNWWNRTIQGYLPFVSGSATAAAASKRLFIP